MYRGSGRQRFLSRDVKYFRDFVRVAVFASPQSNLMPLEGLLAVDVVATPPNAKRRDLDNLLKSLLDAMEHACVFNDDRQVVDLRIRWALADEKLSSSGVVVAIVEL
jgi:crossover junction endodeoxyribonuclease RusA